MEYAGVVSAALQGNRLANIALARIVFFTVNIVLGSIFAAFFTNTPGSAEKSSSFF
jgi:hypothetical protein